MKVRRCVQHFLLQGVNSFLERFDCAQLVVHDLVQDHMQEVVGAPAEPLLLDTKRPVEAISSARFLRIGVYGDQKILAEEEVHLLHRERLVAEGKTVEQTAGCRTPDPRKNDRREGRFWRATKQKPLPNSKTKFSRQSLMVCSMSRSCQERRSGGARNSRTKGSLMTSRRRITRWPFLARDRALFLSRLLARRLKRSEAIWRSNSRLVSLSRSDRRAAWDSRGLNGAFGDNEAPCAS